MQLARLFWLKFRGRFNFIRKKSAGASSPDSEAKTACHCHSWGHRFLSSMPCLEPISHIIATFRVGVSEHLRSFGQLVCLALTRPLVTWLMPMSLRVHCMYLRLLVNLSMKTCFFLWYWQLTFFSRLGRVFCAISIWPWRPYSSEQSDCENIAAHLTNQTWYTCSIQLLQLMNKAFRSFYHFFQILILWYIDGPHGLLSWQFELARFFHGSWTPLAPSYTLLTCSCPSLQRWESTLSWAMERCRPFFGVSRRPADSFESEDGTVTYVGVCPPVKGGIIGRFVDNDFAKNVLQYVCVVLRLSMCLLNMFFFYCCQCVYCLCWWQCRWCFEWYYYHYCTS